MALSTITYNGVTLSLIKTNQFKSETVYTDDGVDKIYTHVTYNCTAVLSPCLMSSSDTTPFPANPAGWINAKRELLLVPRKQLTIVMDGVTILQSPKTVTAGILVNQPLDYDAKRGPFPKFFNIIKYDGSTAIVQYEIETYIEECNLQGLALPPPILSLRWESNYTIDAQYYQSRTVHGTLILNAEVFTKNQALVADAGLVNDNGIFNSQAGGTSLSFLSIPQGWKRENINTSVSSDGLTIRFAITDKETHLAVPKPLVECDARFTQTSGIDQAVITNEIDVQVKGEAKSPFADLLSLACQIVFSRIDPSATTAVANQQTDGIKEWITNFSMTEDIFKNALQVRVTTTMTPAQASSTPEGLINPSGLNFQTSMGAEINVTDIINDKPRYPDGTFVPEKAYLFAYLFNSTVQNPCNVQGATFTQSTSGTSTPAVTSIDHPSTNTPTPPTTPTSQTSNAHNSSPWTDYTIDIVNNKDYHKIQLPIMYSGPYGAGGTCKVIQTAATTQTKEVHWKCTRIGKLPIIPDAQNYDSSKYNLLSVNLHAACNELAQDNRSMLYTRSGTYYYAVLTPFTDTDASLDNAANPILNQVFTDANINPTVEFATNIIGANGQTVTESYQ